MESKKLKHEKDTSKEWSVKSSMICILLLYVLFYHTLKKNQRFQQKGEKIHKYNRKHFQSFIANWACI
jgi:hypothetical protein